MLHQECLRKGKNELHGLKTVCMTFPLLPFVPYFIVHSVSMYFDLCFNCIGNKNKGRTKMQKISKGCHKKCEVSS